MNDLKMAPGDTVTWPASKTKTRCWGLVEWIDDRGVHVVLNAAKRARATIPLDRISGFTPGRAEYDRHM